MRTFALFSLGVARGKLVDSSQLALVVKELLAFRQREPPASAIPWNSEKAENVEDLTQAIKIRTWAEITDMLRGTLPRVRRLFSASENCVVLQDLCFEPLPNRFLMVSLVYPGRLFDRLRSLGFEETNSIGIDKVDFELTGGYYSFARGDKGTKSRYASFFSADRSATDLDEKLARDPIFFAIGSHPHASVAHILGPSKQLMHFLTQTLQSSWSRLHLLSFYEDLEVVVRGWIDKATLRDCSKYDDERRGDHESI